MGRYAAWATGSVIVILCCGVLSSGLAVYSFAQVSDRRQGTSGVSAKEQCDRLRRLKYSTPFRIERTFRSGGAKQSLTCIWPPLQSAVRITTQVNFSGINFFF